MVNKSKLIFILLIMIACEQFIIPIEAYGQKINKDDKMVIIDSLESFFESYRKSLCLCENLREGKIDESSKSYMFFEDMFTQAATLESSLFFDTSIVPKQDLTPMEYRDLAKELYNFINIKGKDIKYYFLENNQLNFRNTLNSFSNLPIINKINDSVYSAKVWADLGKYEGIYPTTKTDYLIFDTIVDFKPQSNFKKNNIYEINVHFQTITRKFGFLGSKTKFLYKPGSAKVLSIYSINSKQYKPDTISDAQSNQSLMARLGFSSEDSLMIDRTTRSFLYNFYEYLMLRDKNNNITVADSLKLIEQFSNKKLQSIKKDLFFNDADDQRINVIEFIDLIRTMYTKNSSRPNFNASETLIKEITIPKKNVMRIKCISNPVSLNYLANDKSNNFNKDETKLNVILECKYSQYTDKDTKKNYIELRNEDIKVWMLSDTLNDNPIKIDNGLYYSLGGVLSLGFSNTNVKKNDAFNGYHTTPEICFAGGLNATFFPKVAKQNMDVGLGIGFYFQQINLTLSMDAFEYSFDDENDLGEFVHLVSGEKIKQQAKVSSFLIPVTCNVKKFLKKDRFISVFIGPAINYQLNTDYPVIEGIITHKGNYDFVFPNGEIAPTLVEDVPFYHFTDYNSDLVVNQNTYKTISLSGILGVDYMTRISKSSPLYLNIGSLLQIGITNIFESASENNQGAGLADIDGNTLSLFMHSSSGRFYSGNLYFGLTYYLKKRGQIKILK